MRSSPGCVVKFAHSGGHGVRSLRLHFHSDMPQAQADPLDGYKSICAPILQEAMFVYEDDARFHLFHKFGTSIVLNFSTLRSLTVIINCPELQDEVDPGGLVNLLGTVPLLVNLKLVIFSSCPVIQQLAKIKADLRRKHAFKSWSRLSPTSPEQHPRTAGTATPVERGSARVWTAVDARGKAQVESTCTNCFIASPFYSIWCSVS